MYASPKMIDTLLPRAVGSDLDSLLVQLTAVRGNMPFNDQVMDFVGTLSRTVLVDRNFREHPELMAMAHWFRPASLRELRANFLAGNEGRQDVFVPRGVVFHIAPSNVDSVFIYSWLLSLLCGNANIARVSRRRSPQMRAFFDVTAAILERKEYRSLREGNLALSYDHDTALTERLSTHCHLRVIWGGDKTIRQIRILPLPPLATELVFANRFSLAIINAEALLELDAEGLRAIAHGFYNDAFWFNQQACSSPRTVVWVGEAGSTQRARTVFWPVVSEQVRRRQPENLPAQVMDRTTSLFRLAHDHVHARAETLPGSLPSRILVPKLKEEDRDTHDGNGLFIEVDTPSLDEVVPMLASRDQTIAYFGFERKDWLSLLHRLPPHAADRIVPIGSALAFSPVWDGVNLLRSFTRELNIS